MSFRDQYERMKKSFSHTDPFYEESEPQLDFFLYDSEGISGLVVSDIHEAFEESERLIEITLQAEKLSQKLRWAYLLHAYVPLGNRILYAW